MRVRSLLLLTARAGGGVLGFGPPRCGGRDGSASSAPKATRSPHLRLRGAAYSPPPSRHNVPSPFGTLRLSSRQRWRLRWPVSFRSTSSVLLAVASASSSELPSQRPVRSNAKSRAKEALRHVLEEVCRFREDSGVMTALRSGVISDIDALCDLTDEEVSAVVRLGGPRSERSDRSDLSTAEEAVRHVLEEICQFSDDSAIMTAFRSGVISDIDALYDLTDEEVYGLVGLGVGDDALATTEAPTAAVSAAVSAAAAATPRTPAHIFETSKIKRLQMWRSYLRRRRGGISPKGDDWLKLTSDDFRQFRALIQHAEELTGGGATCHLAIEAAVQADVAQEFVNSITRHQPEPIEGSDGMSVMPNVVQLGTETAVNIVIRKVTRPFWQACIDSVEPYDDPPPPDDDRLKVATRNWQFRVCAVGTKGIGMTACTPYLIKMLLEQKATVVYLVRAGDREGWFYEFIPGQGTGDSVFVNVYPEQTLKRKIPSLNDPSTYYVVDPGDTRDTCNPSLCFCPKVIIVSPPDAKHWGAYSFYKERDGLAGVLKFVPVWELDELLSARRILGPEMAIQEVERRYSHVGGVPRHIFDDVSFKDALGRQEEAVRFLYAQHEKYPSVQWAIEAIVQETFEAPHPRHALIGYRVVDDDTGTFSLRAYQGEVLATHAFARLVRRFMREAWHDLLLPNVENQWLFEIYTRYLIATKSTRFKCRSGGGTRDGGRTSNDEVVLGGGCFEVRLVGDMVAAAIQRAMVVFYSSPRRDRLMDFLYQDWDGHFHAFRTTLEEKHSVNVADLLQLKERVGDPTKLSVYYVVPELRFDDFVTELVDSRNPPDKGDGATCSMYHVSIPEPIMTEDELPLYQD